MFELFLSICGILAVGCLQFFLVCLIFDAVIDSNSSTLVRWLQIISSLFFLVLSWTVIVYYNTNNTDSTTVRWSDGNGNRTECYFEYDRVLRGKIYVEEKFTVCKK